LLFDLGSVSLISGIEYKGIVGACCVLAAIALFAGFGGAALDHLIALTVGAEHGNEHHDILLVKRMSAWHTSGPKSTSDTLPNIPAWCRKVCVLWGVFATDGGHVSVLICI
jgi:hypothetical protein